VRRVLVAAEDTAVAGDVAVDCVAAEAATPAGNTDNITFMVTELYVRDGDNSNAPMLY